ncbi:hypothetical protein [Streptomyces cyanogenus]
MDRLHSQLSKLEDMFPGCVTEIVEGSIVMNPVRPFHGRTITNLWTTVEGDLVLDPLKGHVVTLWNPGPDGYRGQDTIPYGPELTVDSPLGKLTVPTASLPVDPKAPHPA